jgi:methylmalonyl-CoA/ethylmalonyl-CoA epimerase
MRVTRIDHVSLAVDDLDAAARRFAALLGLAADHREIVADQHVDAAMIPVGQSCVELIAPVEGNESLRRFLARCGPGLHHLCLEVEDLDEALDELRRAGAELIDDRPRVGARGRKIAFVHPRALLGVLLELVERPR